MNTLAIKTTNALAMDVRFDKEMMHVLLNDGREISIPLEWVTKLRNATRKQREKWRLIVGRVISCYSILLFTFSTAPMNELR